MKVSKEKPKKWKKTSTDLTHLKSFCVLCPFHALLLTSSKHCPSVALHNQPHTQIESVTTIPQFHGSTHPWTTLWWCTFSQLKHQFLIILVKKLLGISSHGNPITNTEPSPVCFFGWTSWRKKQHWYHVIAETMKVMLVIGCCWCGTICEMKKDKSNKMWLAAFHWLWFPFTSRPWFLLLWCLD